MNLHRNAPQWHQLLIGAVFIVSSTLHIAHAQIAQKPENIALHRPVTFNKPPNYALSTDLDDTSQLTDGRYASDGEQVSIDNTSAFWVQKGTVGWTNTNPAIITIDLGQVQPISGASFSTAAGKSGVNWPLHIFVGVSDDNATWRFTGELTSLSNKTRTPPAQDYATWRYTTNALKTRGRYIAFAVTQLPFAFVDEIEVYRGPDTLLQGHMRVQAVTGLDEFARTSVMRFAVTNLLTQNAKAIGQELQRATLPPARRQTLQKQLETASAEIETLPVPEASSFRAILPLNSTHARILAVHGAILGVRKAGPVIWKQPRYAWLPLLASPPATTAPPRLQVAMMKNEFRADALLVSNASETPLAATMKLEGALRTHAAALQISAIPWTDTAQGIPVAAALPVLPASNGVYSFTVPAGLTTKVWFSLDSSKLPVGAHHGAVSFVFKGKTTRVPYTVRVSPVTMQTPRLSLGMWDYTDVDKAFDINVTNRASAIALLRSHFVDTAWGQAQTLPLPGATDFNAQNELVAGLNWKPFEAWRTRWPGARQYFVFLNAPTEFAGTTMGTPEFAARVANWARALAQGAKERGLRPQQLGLLLVDEPRNEAKDARIAAWSRAINSSAPELTLFEDPLWERPDLVKDQSALTQVDILCLNLSVYKRGGKPVVDYIKARQAAGQTLWFYQTSEPGHLLNPTTYNRLQAWHAFQQGAKGMGFWCFSDAGAAGTSWNEHLATRPTYTPVFIDKDEVTNGIHWDAVREGLEDYEYLSMLRDHIGTSTNRVWKSQAQKLLDEALVAVVDGAPVSKLWQEGQSGEAADVYRLKVLALLEAASPKNSNVSASSHLHSGSASRP